MFEGIKHVVTASLDACFGWCVAPNRGTCTVFETVDYGGRRSEPGRMFEGLRVMASTVDPSARPADSLGDRQHFTNSDVSGWYGATTESCRDGLCFVRDPNPNDVRAEVRCLPPDRFRSAMRDQEHPWHWRAEAAFTGKRVTEEWRLEFSSSSREYGMCNVAARGYYAPPEVRDTIWLQGDPETKATVEVYALDDDRRLVMTPDASATPQACVATLILERTPEDYLAPFAVGFEQWLQTSCVDTLMEDLGLDAFRCNPNEPTASLVVLQTMLAQCGAVVWCVNGRCMVLDRLEPMAEHGFTAHIRDPFHGRALRVLLDAPVPDEQVLSVSSTAEAATRTSLDEDNTGLASSLEHVGSVALSLATSDRSDETDADKSCYLSLMQPWTAYSLDPI